jgi:choline kinase
MIAVILAAGRGTRLAPLTDELPKPLVQVAGKTILQWQVEALSPHVSHIFVAGGYRFDQLSAYCGDFENVTLFENKEWETTNNLFSFLSAMSSIDINEDVLVINGDIVFDEKMASLAINSSPESNIIMSKPGHYIEESMKITVQGERVTSISKATNSEDAYAISLDFYKIAQGTVAPFVEHCKGISERENNKCWFEVGLNSFLADSTFRPMDANACRWWEVDNHDDLKQANEIFHAEARC